MLLAAVMENIAQNGRTTPRAVIPPWFEDGVFAVGDCLNVMRSHSTEWLESRRVEVVAEIRRLQAEEHSIVFVLDERGRVDVSLHVTRS
jgi:hypothetical protein